MIEVIKRHWVLLLAIVYVISPIDFIPELLAPVLGPAVMIDDLVLLILAIIHSIQVEHAFQQAKSAKNIIEGEIVKP